MAIDQERAAKFRKENMTWEFAQGRHGEMYSRAEVERGLAAYTAECVRAERKRCLAIIDAEIKEIKVADGQWFGALEIEVLKECRAAIEKEG